MKQIANALNKRDSGTKVCAVLTLFAAAAIPSALAVFTVTLFVTSTWAAPTEAVLHAFNPDIRDGLHPEESLIFDGAGMVPAISMARPLSAVLTVRGRCSN